VAIITDTRDDIDFLAEEFDKREVYTLFSNFRSMEVLENANLVEAKMCSSKLIASYVFEPLVAKFAEDLIASAVHSDDFDIQQFMVLESNPYCGESYDSTFFDLKAKFDGILIGLVTWENGERVLLKNPDSPELIIRKGDYLIIVVNGSNADLIADEFGINEGTHSDLEPMTREAV